LRERCVDHRAALGIVGYVCCASHSLAAFLRNHLDRPLCKLELAVDHQDARACAGEQDSGRSTVADAVSRGAAARHDGDFSREA
jgi:hypothetical protein